jgi:hypothetical protein
MSQTSSSRSEFADPFQSVDGVATPPASEEAELVLSNPGGDLEPG